MKHKRKMLWCLGLAAAALPLPMLQAATTPADSTAINKKYEALQAQMAKMAQQMAAMKQQMAAMKQQQAQQNSDAAALSAQATQHQVQQLYSQVMKESQRVAALEPGTSQFLVVGDATVEFDQYNHGGNTFSGDISPVILWQVDKKILVQLGLDFFSNGNNGDFGGNGGNGTAGDVGFADVSYFLNDYVTIGGGMFPPFFGAYNDHFDAPWNHQLVDDPLVYSSGITPPVEVGGYVEGAVPLGSAHFNYEAYVANGSPLISTDGASLPPGWQDYGDTSTSTYGKAVGIRLGLVPMPALEVGYSFEWARPGVQDGAGNTISHITAIKQALDLNYGKVIRSLRGLVRVRAGWVWQNIGGADYPAIAEVSPFNDDANGGFFQLYYQPSMSNIPYLKNLGFVGRYDRLDMAGESPAVSTGFFPAHEQRWAIGTDYWVDPDVVIKLEYEFDNVPHAQGNDAFFAQFVVGL